MGDAISFSMIPKDDLLQIVPFLQQLGGHSIDEQILRQRVLEMGEQHYECLGIYDTSTLIGVCGMWFQTRHYAGKSCEIDHVIVDSSYRSQGIGKRMMAFVYAYAKSKGCNWVELNTYVDNYPSHKFYNNEGFIARGYHFVKTL